MCVRELGGGGGGGGGGGEFIVGSLSSTIFITDY